jgi:hypothetical protein
MLSQNPKVGRVLIVAPASWQEAGPSITKWKVNCNLQRQDRQAAASSDSKVGEELMLAEQRYAPSTRKVIES